MHENRRTVKILLPDGQLLPLAGMEVRFEPFYPDAIRQQLPAAEAETVAFVCLDATGEETARIKMSALLGYLID